jgi:uncharacterized repeat protein (TIGR03803 family)
MRGSNRWTGVLIGALWIVVLDSCGGSSTSVPPSYPVGGTLSGLASGASVVLQNAGGDQTTVSANGNFEFAKPIPNNGSYSVSVARQPPAQVCTVTGGTGSGVTANVSGISVLCRPATGSVLYSFDADPDGASPSAKLIQGSDGNFYGTTYVGGLHNVGTVFKVTPAGVETVLHSFSGGPYDGALPTASLIQGHDGNLYGATGNGGPTGQGTVFKITPGGVETLLYAFAAGDGNSPQGALTQGTDGNFYGTTSGGGSYFNGTVFKLTPAGVETTLHAFAGGTADGRIPAAGLIQGNDGNLYGTTQFGGTADFGTVFKITPDGVETLLHSFAGGTDGDLPEADLIQGNDGKFYGTTALGGTSCNCGTVFTITPAGAETVLYAFTGLSGDASSPKAALVQGSDGNFYGAAAAKVFGVTSAGIETIVYSVPNSLDQRGLSYTALVQASDGNFYGMSQTGGISDSGFIYRLTPAGVETTLHSFNSGPEGQFPNAIIQGKDGNLYGTTANGGPLGLGTVFEITLDGVENILHTFSGGSTDGSHPGAPLLHASDGNFYGTTLSGGANGYGTVFVISPSGVESILYSFTLGDANMPLAALIQGTDGNFYGTSAGGGTGGIGTVFKITATGVETVLYSFTGGTDGNGPQGALIQGTDSSFYGTTFQGGASGAGTVFKITASGVESVLHSFANGSGASFPLAALIQGTDGNFYGTTGSGGVNNGTVFKITPSGTETVLYAFTGGGRDGSQPRTSLIQASDGNFYGTTAAGGLSNVGTLFQVTPGGVETLILSFDQGPPNSIILGSDGLFYGTAGVGGTSGMGSVFVF